MTTEEEVEELLGRLTAFYVCYPDVENRIRPVTENLQRLLDSVKGKTKPGLLNYVVTDLTTLSAQLMLCYEKFPELRKQLTPILHLLEKLLGPA